jgi:biopolymer transport protein ExbB
MSLRSVWAVALAAVFAVALSSGELWGQGPAGGGVSPDANVGDSNALDANVADANTVTAGDEELTWGYALVLKLKQGGTTMIFLALASVAGLAYTIERLVHLRRGAVVPTGLANYCDKLWSSGQMDKLEQIDKRDRSTMARVISVIVRHRGSGMADVSMMAGDVASRDLRRHNQKAYPLAVIATISPLLGLFGTIVGMIGAFDKVSAAGSMGDASMLGGDISKALITTGTGLAIAIPTLALYHFFKSRTSLYGIILEEEASELITKWFAEGRKVGADGEGRERTGSEAVHAG